MQNIIIVITISEMIPIPHVMLDNIYNARATIYLRVAKSPWGIPSYAEAILAL